MSSTSEEETFLPLKLELSDADKNKVELENKRASITLAEWQAGVCGQYQAEVSDGTYYYAAYDPNTGKRMGEGSFEVGSDEKTHYEFLTLYDWGKSKTITNKDKIAFSLEITGSDGKTQFPVGEDGLTAVLPVRDGADDGAYTYAFIPEDKGYWGSSGKLWTYKRNYADSFGALNGSEGGQTGFLIAPKTTIQLQVETGASVRIVHLGRFYRPMEYIEGKKVSSDDGFDIWEFEVPNYSRGTAGCLHYEVRKEGKITQAKTFATSKYADRKEILVVPALKDNPELVKRDESQGYYQASILLNGSTSKMVSLEKGESFDIWASRAWQAINADTDNYYVDPDFHYTLISGDSIKIREDGRVTAVGDGVSVVQITYDALEYDSADKSTRDRNGMMVYSAIWPERTGVLVFNVGDENKAGIETNINLTEYDTIYYAKTINGNAKDEYAEYSFTPTAKQGQVNVRVQKPLTVNWSDGWEDYTADEKGTYKIKLYSGPNIVEISSGNSKCYHVIYASGLDVNIAHKNNTERESFAVGDTAVISFSGLILPQPKLGAVYNPGYPSETYIEYKNDGATVTGQHSQWQIRKYNSITVQLEEEGIYRLDNGKIHASTIGEVPTQHQKLTKEGMKSHYNYTGGDSAESFNGYFCVLPDIEISVSEKTDDGADENRFDIIAKICATFGKGINSNPIIGHTSNAKQTASIFCTGNMDDYTPTKAVSGEPLPKNMVIWHAQYALKAKASPVYVRLAKPIDGVDMKLRYWSSSDGTVKTLDLPDNEIVNTESFAKLSDIAYFEYIITPQDGVKAETKTYTVVLNHYKSANWGKFAYLYDLKFNTLDGKTDMKSTDGILHADKQDNIDFGYGFLGTETEYTVTVPYTTTKVALNPTALEETKIVASGKTVAQADTTVTITVNGEKVTNKTDSQEIELTGALTEIPVVVTVSGEDGTVYDTKTYTVKVQRAEGPRKVTFETADGVSILVKNAAGKKQTAEEDGYYLLEKGDYTVTASKLGYLAQAMSFTVGDDLEYTFTIPELTELEKQSGTATVSIAGADTVLLRTSEREIGDPADLAKEKYVEYNYGGYTVLQSLIEAMQDNGIGFSCRKGQLVPDATPTDNQNEEAGWICEINGKVCENPAETLVNDGDAIVYYYSAGYEGMRHASLTPEVKELTRGQTATLYLTATPVKNDGTAGVPVAGADIYEGTERLGTTNENGAVEISSNEMKLGVHFLTAVKKNESDQNILTSVVSMISVKKPDDTSAAPNTTTVTFRLIGDTNHGDDQSLHEYTTWIATGTYTFEKEEVTVGEVFETALKEAGLSYSGLENNYIREISAPESCGGYSLAEMSNSPRSGWMYTVNGFHPGQGLAKYYVTTGDEIVFHYVDDYLTEILDWSSGTQGNASTWNKWLEALDETPGAKAKAAAVDEKIAEIGKEISLDDDSEDKIVAARKDYDALTREEKSYVKYYDTLKEAEKALKDLKKKAADQEAAQKVIDEITALPGKDDLMLKDKTAVEDARTHYEELTPDQKGYVSEEVKGTLVTAEERMAELLKEEAPDLLVEEIEKLPSVDKVTLQDEAAIASAKAHYDVLSPEQITYLENSERGKASLKKLSEVIDALNELLQKADDQKKADEVSELLEELPDAEKIVFANQNEIAAARTAYDALGELQPLVREAALKKLTDAEDSLKKLQAGVDAVVDLIDKLPATEELEIGNADQVAEARSAYEALNNDQKQRLKDNGALSNLLVAENQISWLQKEAQEAQKVADQINSLPAVKDLKLSNKSAVQAARNAYEGLNETQKKMISDALKALEEREEEIAKLESLTPTPSPDPSPDPNPNPTPTPDPTPSDQTVTLTYQNYPISVLGKLSGYELRLVGLKAADDSVKRMQSKISSKEALIRLYDVNLYLNGTEVDWDKEITINFQVGDKYNGKKLTVLHDVDGRIEKLKGTVSDGILSVTADSLSPFGVVVTASTVTGSGVTNSDSTTTTTTTGTNGNLNGTINGTTNGTTAEGVTGTGNVTSAQTGDNTDILLPVAGLITASGVLAGVILYYKKKRKNTGVQTEEEK